jgi:hypothetical protein
VVAGKEAQEQRAGYQRVKPLKVVVVVALTMLLEQQAAQVS